jgi:hypothetical protein
MMSALPPKADIVLHAGKVRFVPKADSCSAAIFVTRSPRRTGGNGMSADVVRLL